MSQSSPLKSTFSSADFAKVPATLRPDQPECLLHADVLGANQPEDASFSHERKHLVRMVNLPSRVISMTLGGLLPGQATGRHRHNYETIIYVLSGSGHSIIEDRRVEWRAGDAFYVPIWAWHQHFNGHFYKCSITMSTRWVAHPLSRASQLTEVT
ncbi:MAG: cupin domain-containing protein [Burkholderiales bacterium]